MPNVQFVCPHCEKHAEVQVASVTRSRTCPHCGGSVLLQVPGKEKKKTRRALLVAPTKDQPLMPEKAPSAPGMPAYEPQPLEGEVYERMKADPEIRAIRQRLVIGSVTVIGLIIFSIVWHYSGGGTATGDLALRQDLPAETHERRPAQGPLAAERAPSGNTIDLHKGEGDKASPAGKLVFVTQAGKTSEALDAVVRETAAQRLDRAKEVIFAFLSADSVGTMLLTVANRGRVETRLRAYYEGHTLTPLHANDIQPRQDDSARADEVPVLVTLSNGRKVPATVLVTAEGHFGVDWPSFVALSEMEWSQFIATKPASPVMFRVMAEAGDWYSGSFADSRKFQCLKLMDPNNPGAAPCFAYADRAGAVGQAMEKLLQGGAGAFPVTLRLKYPVDGLEENQALVESIVTKGWFLRPDGGITQAEP